MGALVAVSRSVAFSAELMLISSKTGAAILPGKYAENRRFVASQGVENRG
jgi:hypothetical protein